jgi:hypothetical protein
MRWKSWAGVAVAAALGACGGAGHGVDEPGHGAAEAHTAGGMDMGAMMRRHADEGEAMAAETRAHVERMRRLPPAEWHARMGDHVGQVSRMLSLMTRQVREMDMGMGMSDEAMGAMMGMSGGEYRRTREEQAALRAELEALQTAPAPEVRARVPGHLDRVEALARTLDESARAMRGS